MKSEEIIAELKNLGDEGTARVLKNHGAKDPVYGVKIQDLKKILKKTKNDTSLAKELFATGIYDAMYLAGLMANGAEMTSAEIDSWAETAYGGAISEYTIPWVTAENPEGFSLALRWIRSPKEEIAVSGWYALSALAAMIPDEELDLSAFSELLDDVKEKIHTSQNRVKYAMNTFIISAGTYILPLHEKALQTAHTAGKVTVIMNGTSCKVPVASEYILKSVEKGAAGKKRKTVKC